MSNTRKLFESYQNNLNEHALNESEQLYACYEKPFNGKTKTEEQWRDFYNENIDKTIYSSGWRTFEDWWQEMIDDNLIVPYSGLIKTYNVTDYGSHNNSDTVYGELTDGNWYTYWPEFEDIKIYNTAITDEYLSKLYSSEDEVIFNEWWESFNKEHEINNYDQLNSLMKELNGMYFRED